MTKSYHQGRRKREPVSYLKPQGDRILLLLDEIKACAAQIDMIAVETALSRTTNPEVLSEALWKITQLNRRILPAVTEAEEIRKRYSPRALAALEREAEKRLERLSEEEE